MPKSVLNANVRSLVGSSKTKQLRKSKMVPAVLYGSHIQNKSLVLDFYEITRYLSSNNIGSSVYLNVNGEEVFAIVKDVQHSILGNKIVHVDFQALTLGEKIKIKVPFIYKGKDNMKDGLIIQTLMDSIEIQTLPKYLIDKVEIDLTNVALGDSLKVSDLPIMHDENIEVLTDVTLPIYIIIESERFVEPVEAEVEEDSSVVAP